MDSESKAKTPCFITILIMYSIASVTLVILNFISINSDAYNFVDVTNNWQTGAIMQIQVAATCPYGYEEAFNYTWPGTMTGCWCGNVSSFSRFFYNINSNLYTGSCSWNRTLAGCSTLSSINSAVMDVWAQNQNVNMKLCVQRSQETWLQVAQQSGNNCSNSSLKQCGFSPENTFCTSEPLCPINNLIITNLTLPAQNDTLSNCTVDNNCTVLAESPTSAKIIQYQRGDTFDALPTAQMRLNEYSMCLDSTEDDITPGRTDYYLLSSKRSTCYSEGASLWNWTDSMTESELFALNGLTNTINSLEQYGYYASGMDGSDYEYSLFSRSYIPWNIPCRGNMNTLVDNSSTIKTLRVLQLILLIFTALASICLGIILPLILYQIHYNQNHSLKTFAKCFNHIVKIPQLGLQIAVLIISINTKGFFEQIITGDCSTPLVMQTLTSLADDLQKTFIFNVINISMLIFVMLVGTIYFMDGNFAKRVDSSAYYEPPKQYDQIPSQEVYGSDFPQNYNDGVNVQTYSNQPQTTYYPAQYPQYQNEGYYQQDRF